MPIRDLDNVPRMSDAIAKQYREDRYDNLRTIEQILALPTDFARTEALYMLAGRSDSGSVQNLIYEANRIASAIDRDTALTILFSRLTELDPPSALAVARYEIGRLPVAVAPAIRLAREPTVSSQALVGMPTP